MKRHPSLIPISRQHHTMLLLAQLLKKNAPDYRGLPTTLEGKATYALDLYNNLIQSHFALEEEKLIAFIEIEDAEIQVLIQEILHEHQLMKNQFVLIENQIYDLESLHELGQLLDDHIRKEERIFFQKLQAILSEEELQALGKHLGHL